MKKYFPLALVTIILLLSSCAAQAPQQPAGQQTSVPQQPATPSAQAQQQTAPATSGIPEALMPLFAQASTRVKSLSYKYKGPETDNALYNIYLKGAKMAYEPFDKNDYSAENAYDTIFLDAAAKTAMSYCTHQTCIPKGKRSDLTYSAIYIATPLDWLQGITSAEKLGEEQIERRATTIVETNKGKMWIESYFGVPMKVEKDGTTYSYQQMAFNGVTDDQVSPQ